MGIIVCVPDVVVKTRRSYIVCWIEESEGKELKSYKEKRERV